MVALLDFSSLGPEDIVFIPPMEPIAARLATGVFRGVGCRAEVLREDEETLQTGLKHTAGNECTPCPATIGSMVVAMEERKLDPGRVVFFMPTTCGPCRFGQYGTLASLAFRRRGWDRIRVLGPNADNAYGGMDGRTRRLLWHCIVVADVINKIVLKVRPYEVNPGEVDQLTERFVNLLTEEFARPEPRISKVLRKYVESIKAIPVRKEKRPKIAIVGEIYVRHDPFINRGLARYIESLGGEALACTVGEWILYCAAVERKRKRGSPGRPRRNKLVLFLEKQWFTAVEHRYYDIAADLIHDREEPPIEDVIREGTRYVPWEFQTETVLTLGRAVLFIKEQKVDAVVNAAPMFCMPGTISASIFPRIEKEYGVPIISIFYDGSGEPNKVLDPYLHYLVERSRNAAAPRSPERAARFDQARKEF